MSRAFLAFVVSLGLFAGSTWVGTTSSAGGDVVDHPPSMGPSIDPGG